MLGPALRWMYISNKLNLLRNIYQKTFPANTHLYYSSPATRKPLISELRSRTSLQTVRSMWNNRRPADDSAGNGDDREKTIAKTAGFVVFSGIAMSIIKALNPFTNNPNLKNPNTDLATAPPQSAPPQIFKQCQSLELPPPPPPLSEPIVMKSAYCSEQNVVEPSPKMIEIVRGDTLWGLSRKYGVSIEAIKEANGLEGDTIYAGKKLVIP